MDTQVFTSERSDAANGGEAMKRLAGSRLERDLN